MSKERSSDSSSFDRSESKLSQNERQIRKLFKRAGWDNTNTPEARREAVRDAFEQLFEEALFEKRSPYKIKESFSDDKKYFNVAITKQEKTVAVKSMLNTQLDGQPETAYSVVKKAGFLRRNLVFQLIEYPLIDGLKRPPELHIGYYHGEGEAKHILSDEN